MSSLVRLSAVVALFSLAACDSQKVVAPEPLIEGDVASGFSAEDSAALPLLRFAHHGSQRCASAPYRAFDFWVGSWDVYVTDDTAFVGTNVITRATGGCTVEEHWIGADGVRGRSLNAYDASTRTWSQLWMDATGGALLLDGTAGRSTMVLAGTHATNRFDPTPQTDRISWSVTGRQRVRQVGELSVDGGPFNVLYDLTYRGVRTPRAIEPAPSAFCASPARVRYHAFDFLLGSWTVEAASLGVTLQSTVRTDVGGCLVEERMTGPHGYSAVAYSGFRSSTFTWNWMFVDSRGIRILLSGPATLTGTNMILTGTQSDRDGQTVNIRAEWAVVDANTVEQRWEFSKDGGATWTTPTVVTMRK